MRLLVLLGLFAVKVQCVQETEKCPRKKTPPGVLALTMGSEVILGCDGDVTVNGVPLTVNEKQRLLKRAVTTGHLSSQRKGDSGTTGTYSTVRNAADTGTYTETGSDPVTTAKTHTITTEQPITTGRHFTAGQPTRVRRVARAAEEGAYSVTTETGIDSEKDMDMEYEDYEDYEDNEEGLRVTRSIRRRTRWTRNGKKVRGVKRGGALKLPALQLSNSGNYSCYRDDKLVSSVNITVGVPPETPTLSCHKKSHSSKVRCDWISKQPIIQRPQCYLLLQKGFEPLTHEHCSYSVERSRCWCAMPSTEEDRSFYSAKLCVTNTLGSAISPSFNYIPKDIIKPDPPAGLMVKPVEGQVQTLKLSWKNPVSWRDMKKFYLLQFQIRYRPLVIEKHQYVLTKNENSWLILDALPHTEYEVQLQAKDEFDGVWSEWTSPVYAHTWTAPEPTVSYTSLEPFYNEGSGSEDNPEVEITELPVHDGGVLWVSVVWVFGLCLFITLTILSVYALRKKMWFTKNKTDKQSCPPPALQIPLMAPHQQSQHHFLSAQEEEGDGINLHNFDYFLSFGD